ncbi:MAG: murein biosynthesis integral membrane protein MurJ [Candidatus Saccharimonadales bacterium]
MRNRLVSTNFTVHTPGASDAFFVAFQIPDFFFYVIAAGALGVAFIPIISERLHLGDRKGLWELTSSLLNSLAIIMAVVSVILFIFAAPLIHLLAPDLSPAHFNDAVNIMRLISFNPLFFTLSGVVTSIQQAMGRFFFFAIAPLTYNLSIIASIYLFKDNIGIVGLGVGALIGAVLQMLVAWLGMWGLGFKWHPKILWKNQHFRSVLRALPPRSIDQGVDQLNSIVETNRAQALGIGPVSYYNYALTLQNVPIMLIGTSIATAAFPKLTERLANHRPDLFRKDFLAILRVVIWLAVPTVIAMYFCRGYLARLITGDASPKVSTILGFLTASILFRIIYTMISRWFYAQKDTKTPLYISIFAITLNIILAFSLATKDGYNIAGLAMAQSITAAAEVTVLTTIMFLRDRKMLDAALFGSLVKIVAVSGFSIMAAFIMSHLLPLTLADRGIITLGLKLAAIGSVTFAVHILISGFFGMDEARPIFKWLRRIVLHPIKVDY